MAARPLIRAGVEPNWEIQMSHAALNAGNVAVITGGAAGIGLAVAHRLAVKGLSLVLVDTRPELFDDAAASLKESGAPEVMASAVDVADRSAVKELRGEILSRFGHVDVLMGNAGIQPGSDIFDSCGTWSRILDVNLGGIVNMCQVLVPDMVAASRPGLVINTGSKQGITTPPGDPAYNVSKSGVRVFTEALAHQLREDGTELSVHLLIPGFVFTDLTRRGRTERPAGAWTPDQTAEFMLGRLEEGDFYILCPDGEVTRDMDEKRMTWAMGDIVENRPPLSRWHKDWAAAFEAFSRG